MARIGLFANGMLILCTAAALGQTGGGGRMLVRHHAPADQSLDFPLATLQAEFADMMAQKRLTTRMLEGGTYSMNARYLVGSEAAQVHKSIVRSSYFIREGSATLVTGGTIVDKAVRGGVERAVKPGEMLCSFRRACPVPFPRHHRDLVP